MKHEVLVLQAGCHVKAGKGPEHALDTTKAEVTVDFEKRIAWVQGVKDGKPFGKRAWVPFEAISYAVPSQEEPAESKAIRRQRTRESEAAARGDSDS